MKTESKDQTDMFSAPARLNATKRVRIEFDGGTPCNIPRLGYGIGYGSYRIDAEPIVRLDHSLPMSANAAEILTLACALEAVHERHGPAVSIEIHGDSQIALKWAEKFLRKRKINKGATEEFKTAIRRLRDMIDQFAEVKTHWRGRAASVQLFGH